MKPKILLPLICLLTLVAVLAAIALGRRIQSASSSAASVRTFQVHGQIRGLEPENKTIRIAHEEIPDYMPAMTMPLKVKDAALLRSLAIGDSVQFELAVTVDDSWISHMEKISSAGPVTQKKFAATLEELEAGSVHPGEVVPDFELTNQDGRPIHLSEFRGQAVVMTFIYTRCPLPNFCPLMSKNFADLQQRLSKEFPGKFQLLSITMDPEFDQPGVLKDYAARYGANPKNWSFATGDAAAIHFVTELMGLYFERENGLISHDLRTALIGPDGRLIHVWKSNVWTPYEVQRRLRETLTGSEDVAAR
jgi:protein SCO1/2